MDDAMSAIWGRRDIARAGYDDGLWTLSRHGAVVQQVYLGSPTALLVW